MIPEHLKENFGEKITLNEVITQAYDGGCVVVFCHTRQDVRSAMDIFENRIHGGNFLANYNNPMISYNKGNIVFLVGSDYEKFGQYKSTHYYEMRVKT